MAQDDRLGYLEQRLAQVEEELRQTRRQRHVSGRTAHRIRPVVWVLATGALMAGGGALTSVLGIASATTGPGPLTVQAPLRVVDHTGAVVMEASSAGLRFYRDGQVVAAIGGNHNGGLVVTYDTAGQATAALGTDSTGHGELNVGLAGGDHIQVGTKSGSQALRVYKGSSLVAAVGESAGGGVLQVNEPGGHALVLVEGSATGGLVQLNDVAGHPRMFLEMGAGGKGLVELRTTGGGVAAQLQEGGKGGYLGLFNASGIARVEEGVLPNDEGVVRAFGPTGFNFIKGRG